MKKFFKFAACMLAFGALAAACQKPAGTPDVDDPLVNAIEYAGVRADIETVLVDVTTGTLYFTTEEGVRSLDELAEAEYVTYTAGDNAEGSLDGVFETSLTNLPEGFVFAYYKGGEQVLQLTSEDHSAITEGTLKLTVDMENGESGNVDFDMTLVSGDTFRGNIDVVADELVIVLPEPPVTGPEYPENDMTIVLDGESIPVAKAFLETFSGYFMFTATPDASAESYEDILERGLDYVQALLLPGQLVKDLEVSESGVIVYGSIEGLALDPYSVTGTGRLDYDEVSGEGTLKLALVNADGAEIGVNATAVMSTPAPDDNTISVDGVSQPVRAAFYLAEGGVTALYFTSAAVDTFDEMAESAVDYFCIMVPDSDLTGEAIDLGNASEGTYLMYVNNANEEQLEAVTGDAGVSASYSLKKTGDEEYAAVVSVSFADGTEVSVDFEGSCVSVDYVPEIPNEFTYDGMTESIQSALVDSSDPDIWHIWLSSTGGLEEPGEFEDPSSESIHITAPAKAFNGEPCGFSTYKELLKFEYAGQTWTYKEGDSAVGTLTVSLEDGYLTVDFTNYDNFSGHYSGPAVVVE